jgi:hypothetical protein
MLERGKVKSLLFTAIIFFIFTISGCGTQTDVSPIGSSNDKQGMSQTISPVQTTEITASTNNSENVAGSLSPDNSSDTVENNIPEKNTDNSAAMNDYSKVPDRLDIVYFHRPQRCVTCLCFEERINYVVENYFEYELDSGRLTYKVANLGDKANQDLITQYGAISSQLFLNSVKEGTDHIEDILEIWDWNCRQDKEGFDWEVRNIIESRLKGES